MHNERRAGDGPDPSTDGGGRAPLAGIRVVTIEHAVAGPLCSRHLADLGADVIKVERTSGGDLARGYDSVVKGQSAYFVWANRGKRSVALDLRSHEGREFLSSLLDTADVFVSNLGPGAVERLGVGPDALARRWPRLVHCTISGYGSGGPYGERKAFDLLVQGEAGLISLTGTPETPCKVGVSMADMCAGLYALSAILLALRERDLSGSGRGVSVSLLDCMAEWVMAPAYHRLYGDAQPARAGGRHNMMVPYGIYSVGESEHVNLAVQTDAQWERLCRDVLRRPELAEDDRFATNERRVRSRELLEPIIEEEFARCSLAELIERLELADIPFGSVNDLGALLDHPQLHARERWTTADSPGGPIRALRSPFVVDGFEEPRGAVPALGEHTEELRVEIAERAGQAAGPPVPSA